MIHVRNVPDGLHEELMGRARARGQTLTDYIQEILEREVAPPQPEEVFERIRRSAPVDLRGSASVPRLEQALGDFLDLPLTRHGHAAFLQRCFDLRDVLSGYDAAYVVLTEGLGASLVTADRRLARAAAALGIPCLPA